MVNLVGKNASELRGGTGRTAIKSHSNDGRLLRKGKTHLNFQPGCHYSKRKPVNIVIQIYDEKSRRQYSS